MNGLTPMTQEWVNGKMNPFTSPKPINSLREKWSEVKDNVKVDNQATERVIRTDNSGFSHLYINAPISDEFHRALYEEWFEPDLVITSQMVRDDLAKAPGDIFLHINTPGGDVFEAVAIYDELYARKARGDKIICSIEGLCASAGGILLTVGTERQISNFGTLMLHFVLSGAYIYEYGFVEDLERAYNKLGNQINQMKKLNEQYLKEYSEIFGIDEATMREYMQSEEFFVGEEAVTKGFVDRVIQKKDKEKVDNEITDQYENESPSAFRSRMYESMKNDGGRYFFA